MDNMIDMIILVFFGYFILTLFVIISVGLILASRIRDWNDKLTKYQMMQLLNEGDGILIRDNSCKHIEYHSHITTRGKEDILVIDLK